MRDPDVPALTVVRPGEGETVRIPGFGATYKIRAKDSDGAVSIVEHPFAVGTITAAHRHSNEDEYSIVVAGEIGFRSDDSEVVLGAGGYIIKPRGQMHAMWNAGDVPGRIIEIIVPGGFESYFGELGDLLAAHSSGPGDYAELATRHGLTYDRPDWWDDVIERYHLTAPTH
jgi:quercetin dioxygenase-like cupin family protein